MEAEGQRQSQILKAEGEREAMVLRAQGYAKYLENIFSIAKGIDKNTMNLQYLETLKEIGSANSTKIVIPAEITSLLKGIFSKENV